jgi:hypothetical protein
MSSRGVPPRTSQPGFAACRGFMTRSRLQVQFPARVHEDFLLAFSMCGHIWVELRSVRCNENPSRCSTVVTRGQTDRNYKVT